MKKLIFVFAIILGIATLAFGQYEDEATRDSLRLMEEMGIPSDWEPSSPEITLPTTDFDEGYINFGRGGAQQVAIDGNYAFVANLGWVEVVDITNPYVPVVIASHPSPGGGNSYDVAVHGNYILVTRTTPGNGALDVYYFDSAVPSLNYIGGYHSETLDQYRDIAVRGNRAFIVTRSGLEVLNIQNIADPSSITLEKYIEIGFHNKGIAVDDRLVYVAGGHGGGLCA